MRDGMEFTVKKYNPPAKAIAEHNRRIEFYRKLDEAFHRWGQANEGASKTAATFGIFGDLQADAKRSLFNMRLPGIIEAADRALAGYTDENGVYYPPQQVVISLVSVSAVNGEEGNLAAAIDKINTHETHKIGEGQYSDPTAIPEALVEIGDLRMELASLPELPPLLICSSSTTAIGWGSSPAR